MTADVRLTGAPLDALTINAAGDAFALIAPFGDGWYRVIAWNRWHQVPDTAPVGLDELRDVTRRSLGTDYGMHDPRWMSRFHSDERQVPRYRTSRVFRAGDAAHVHSPAGGQGMNTSIQDAANLSWKIAAAVNGWAPRGLLDSYNTVVLVRPDGHIAWATDEPQTHRPAAAVHKALTDWCGGSTAATAPPVPEPQLKEPRSQRTRACP